MKNNYSLNFKGAFVVLLFFVCFPSISQTTTVFTDDFTSFTDQYYTITPGVIGDPVPNPKWKMARSGADFGSAIGSRGLYLTNSGSAANNLNGYVLASVQNSELSLPYSATLSANPGVVTWTFNMRQSRSNPNGFGASGHGVAFILAGTNGTTNLTGTGYAVILGQAFATDYIRLVRYNSGIRNFTTLVQSKTSGLTDFGSNYTSIKVTYDPTTNVWQLFLRNDGPAQAGNPLLDSDNLKSQGSVSNTTYVNNSLPLLGAYLNGGTAEGFVAYYKYINVDVDVPYITSIAPSSKVAGTAGFNLVVTGRNFRNGVSNVMWNGGLRTTTFNSASQLTAAITAADIATAGTAQVSVINGTTISNEEVFTIDSPGVPTLTPSASIVNLATTTSGTASAVGTYTVNGINLTANPVITAPANFEISANGSAYNSSVTLTRDGFNLTPQPTTISIRTKSTAVPGIYSSIISNTVSGGINKQVTIKAKVIAAKPTLQTSTLNFTNVTSSSFKLEWTIGNGARRIILMRAASAVNGSPLNENTYMSNSVFGGGAELGTGNFVVYSGTGNNTVVTGLSAATTYYVSIFEYNGTLSGTENYFTTGPLIGNQVTRNAALGWQIYATNAVNTIDFDNTVDGVNTDAFQGSGIGPDGDSGDLNSKSWAISGFSDGNVGFGIISPEDSDYDSGTSEGGVLDGGLYSFETSPNNFSLGIQATDLDFTPGAITLRIQNQTSAAMTSLNVGYKVYIRNDQASSSTFNFSHSANNSSYTPVTAIVVESPGAADPVPQWKAYYRVTTITGLNIASGGYYYLRWTGGDSGNVVYDEFALDDIVLVANPSSTYVPFNNTAESFVLNGNAQLSGDLQVDNNLTFENNAKLSIGANTLSIKGSLTNTTLLGIKGGATSNLTINGTSNNSLSFDSTNLGITNLLNNFTIATTSANTTTLGNAVVVNGALTIDANQTLDLGTIPLTGSITSAVVNGILATQNTSALSIPSGKTWSGIGTVHYNGTAAQTVVAGTYNSLTVSPTAGAVAGGNLVVNGILDLPKNNPTDIKGSLSLGANTLTMGGNATNTGIGDVTGDILRTSIVANVLYTFGHKNTSIIFPVVAGQTLPTSMGLRVDIGTAATWRASSVKRIYDFKQTGGSGTKAVIRGHYLDSELNGNVESKLVDFAYEVGQPLEGTEQGKSNYDTTENWIELTNADVANVFASVFDAVKLTFDESELTVLTWNGSISNSWTTAANWTPSGSPSSTVSVVIPTGTPRDPVLNFPNSAVLNMTIENGGILYAPDDSGFSIHGADGAWINNGEFRSGNGGSKVIFIDPNATIAGNTTFNNLTISPGAGLRPLSGNKMNIKGVFDKQGAFTPGGIANTVEFSGVNQTIPKPSGGLVAYNNLIISDSSTGAIFPSSLNITGDLTINSTVNFSNTTINMTGLTPQTIGGTDANFTILNVENTNGNVSLVDNVSVSDELKLTSGQLILNDKNFNLGAKPVAGASFNATKMIVTNGLGEVRRPFTAVGTYSFPVGDNATPAYSPITVNVTSGNFASAYVGVSVKDGIHPNNGSIQNNLSRYWNVNQSGITGTVANISATYLPEDLTGAESTIAAAQLKGTFNQSTNPWIKFGALASNTLNITGALLPNGVTSAFTGIKGETFKTVITGYGEFCQNNPITLTAETVGGDGPFTYVWNGLGSASTANPPSSAFGTVTYTLTVRDANGIVAMDSADVTILTASVGGTVSATPQIICKGTKPDPIVLTGQTGDVLYWQRSADPTFAVETINISNITATLSSDQAGIVNETTYFRAVVSNGTCGQVYSTVATAEIKSTTWNGTGWSAGLPNDLTSVIITGNYGNNVDPFVDLEACTLTIENNAIVSIPSGKTLTINGALVVTSGSLTIEDGASFVQKDDSAINTGINFTMRRKAKPMYRYDYTYWSSPVIGRTLYDLSPATLGDKFFGWNPDPAGWIPYYNGNHVMEPGVGYIVRAPQTYSVDPAVVATFEGVYTGTPNNGIVSVPVAGSGKYNLLGNPYPSALSADKFITANSGSLDATLYLWTHSTSVASVENPTYSYNPADYAVYNLMGGVGTSAASTDLTATIPAGFVASGQAFFIAGRGTQNGTATFNNSMRVPGLNSQFFKIAAPTAIEKHRMWFNISNTVGDFRQMLLGYTTNATNDYDNGWDGELFSNSGLTIYGFAGQKQLSIEALPLPFSSSVAVPLGISTIFSGSHRIKLDHLDGLFETQEVFLYDKLLQIVHNIKLAPYDFVSGTGTFDNRFEVVYYNVLGDQDFTYENNLYIYKEKETIVVKSPSVEMKSIRIIDMQGRVIETVLNINDFQAVVNLKIANQVLMVSITTQDNQVFTRKLLY